jgi:hypothetical protein
MDKRHKKYFIALEHDRFDVQTHESIMTGEKVTIVKFPSAMQAWMQLRPIMEDLEEIVFNDN